MTGYCITITDEAEAEFDAEINYSVRRWGKRHALAYAQALRRAVRSIAEMPFAHPVRQEWGDGVRGQRYKGNLILYRTHHATKTIEIIGFPSIYRLPHPRGEDAF
jgi:plasmid stabilization system protein ParE